MSLTKLVKIGPVRPQSVRRGRRRRDAGKGKPADKKAKLKSKVGERPKEPSRRVTPELLKPAKIHHIERKDFETYETKSRFIHYPDLCYELAYYHERLVRTGQRVRPVLFIRKAVELCQSLGLRRSDIGLCNNWVFFFLTHCVKVREHIEKERCTCDCTPLAVEAEGRQVDAEDSPTQVAPSLLKSGLNNVPCEDCQKRQARGLCCLFLTSSKTCNGEKNEVVTNGVSSKGSTNTSSLSAFSDCRSTTGARCSGSETDGVPISNCNTCNRSTQVSSSTCPVHCPVALQDEPELFQMRNVAPAGRSRLALKRKRSCIDEPVKKFRSGRARLFPDYSFSELLPHARPSVTIGCIFDPVEESGPATPDVDVSELFSIFNDCP